MMPMTKTMTMTMTTTTTTTTTTSFYYAPVISLFASVKHCNYETCKNDFCSPQQLHYFSIHSHEK
jgi:hypothetical protein